MPDTVQVNTRLLGGPGLEELVKMAIRHDYLLYNDKEGGMKEESLYEWARFCINRRLTEITSGIR